MRKWLDFPTSNKNPTTNTTDKPQGFNNSMRCMGSKLWTHQEMWKDKGIEPVAVLGHSVGHLLHYVNPPRRLGVIFPFFRGPNEPALPIFFGSHRNLQLLSQQELLSQWFVIGDKSPSSKLWPQWPCTHNRSCNMPASPLGFAQPWNLSLWWFLCHLHFVCVVCVWSCTLDLGQTSLLVIVTYLHWFYGRHGRVPALFQHFRPPRWIRRRRLLRCTGAGRRGAPGGRAGAAHRWELPRCRRHDGLCLGRKVTWDEVDVEVSLGEGVKQGWKAELFFHGSSSYNIKYILLPDLPTVRTSSKFSFAYRHLGGFSIMF